MKSVALPFFVQKGESRVRIIHAAHRSHVGFAVQTASEFNDLCRKFSSDQQFVAGKKDKDHTDETARFVYQPTGQQIRIIHRHHPIFEGTFGKPFS